MRLAMRPLRLLLAFGLIGIPATPLPAADSIAPPAVTLAPPVDDDDPLPASRGTEEFAGPRPQCHPDLADVFRPIAPRPDALTPTAPPPARDRSWLAPMPRLAPAAGHPGATHIRSGRIGGVEFFFGALGCGYGPGEWLHWDPAPPLRR